MEELKAILITHAKRYPLMQPRDAVKLIYQNEFGGGHLIRAVKPENLEQLGRDFIRSAAKHKGTLDSFLNKLEVLQTLTTEGVFAFDLDALNTYLSEYKAAGYPAVSHSEQYRQAYKPAYRIIRNAYL